MVDQVARNETGVWFVAPELASIRLDVFLRRSLPHLSGREIDLNIKAKLFLLDGKVAKKGARLAAGARLEYTGPASWLAERPVAVPDLSAVVVYEDSSILVLDKPAGMATHGFSARHSATLANYIAARWPDLLNVGKSRWEPGILHRLDIETSGLILVAKNQTAFDRLRVQFQQRQVRKTYWALVWGAADIQGTIDLPLEHDRQDRRRMRVAQTTRGSKHGRTWSAQTIYRKLAEAKGLSLLEIEMATGVTHQIRVHLAAVGHPIVGDGIYRGSSTEKFGLQRHFLHAKALELHHPEDNRKIAFEALLASELESLLERLGIKS
ncbi:MAG TPA: RluA family pseudouridine synthase [Candidatus Binatus sp.]|nr:RluA family pseudouridine synthase [Candidatus Binatus sp.]